MGVNSVVLWDLILFDVSIIVLSKHDVKNFFKLGVYYENLFQCILIFPILWLFNPMIHCFIRYLAEPFQDEYVLGDYILERFLLVKRDNKFGNTTGMYADVTLESRCNLYMMMESDFELQLSAHLNDVWSNHSGCVHIALTWRMFIDIVRFSQKKCYAFMACL